MKATLTTLNATAITLISTATLAHPGHDHAAPEATIVHLGFYAIPIALAALIGYLAWKKKLD